MVTRKVVNELTRCDAERRSDVHESQGAGIALPVLDVDEPAKAQPAAFCELFQAVVTLLSQATNLHTEGLESRIRRRFTSWHTARPSASPIEHHEQLCIIAGCVGNPAVSAPRAAQWAFRETRPSFPSVSH